MPESTAPAPDGQLQLICPECGYDLRSIHSQRCPECGLAIDRATMSVSHLPWSHRQSIGRWRAYWRTNLLVLLRPKRLAEEIARPVSFSDSQRFRHLTVFIAWVSILFPFVAILATNWAEAWAGFGSLANRPGWWLETAIFLALLATSWLALLMISGVGSYFFHPAALPLLQQNRAVALSYYTCAPLAWLWLPAVCCAISIGLSDLQWGQFGFGEKLNFWMVLGTVGSMMVIALICWSRVVQLMHRVTHCGAGRTLTLMVYLPTAWAICLAVALLIPATVLYVSLIILSFR